MPDPALPLMVATTNPGKAASFERRIRPWPVEFAALELVEPQHLEVARVAAEKAAQAFSLVRRPVVVEDGGLVVPALGGWPGAYSKPFLQAVGLEGLTRLVGPSDPRAYFDSAVVYHDENGPVVFEGPSRHGRLVAPRGDVTPGAWGSLWKVFVPDGDTRTLAEMGDEEVHACASVNEPIARFATWWRGRCEAALARA